MKKQSKQPLKFSEAWTCIELDGLCREALRFISLRKLTPFVEKFLEEESKNLYLRHQYKKKIEKLHNKFIALKHKLDSLRDVRLL